MSSPAGCPLVGRRPANGPAPDSGRPQEDQEPSLPFCLPGPTEEASPDRERISDLRWSLGDSNPDLFHAIGGGRGSGSRCLALIPLLARRYHPPCCHGAIGWAWGDRFVHLAPSLWKGRTSTMPWHALEAWVRASSYEAGPCTDSRYCLDAISLDRRVVHELADVFRAAAGGRVLWRPTPGRPPG